MRSQHVVLHGAADARLMLAAMRPGVERSRPGGQSAAPLCLVITPTVEQALGAAEQARALLGGTDARVVPVTAASRARRILTGSPVAVVTGTATSLLALRRDSALHLDGVQSIVIIGLDEQLLEGDGLETLQSLLGDAPDEVSRTVTIAQESPATAAFLEAQLRRARQIVPAGGQGEPLPMTPAFVITSAAGRAETLRHILDAIDPPSLIVLATTDTAQHDAQRALTRLGVTVDGHYVQVVAQATAQHAALVVLWEVPASTEALVSALASRPVDAITLLLADELPAFRRMSGGEAVAWAPPARRASAESTADVARSAITQSLREPGGASASEMALLAPLLDRHDPLEIAAAALRLFEASRCEVAALRAKIGAPAGRVQASAQGGPRVGGAGARGGLTVMQGGGNDRQADRQKVFLGVGTRDGVRVGDVVGAIANEAGIPGEQIGQVDLFESHSIVDLSSADAAKVVAALSSVTLRGRRLNARVDDRAGAAPRPGASRGGPPRGPAGRGDRAGPRAGGRGMDRGDRGSDRGSDRGGTAGARRSSDRSEERGGDRPGRDSGGASGGPSGHGPQSNRPPRAGEEKRAFGDRPPQERTEGRAEWSERSTRMNNARRTPRPPQSEPVEPGDEG